MELMGITNQGAMTLAAILVFCLYPQTWFPQLCITAVALPGTKMGETDNDGGRFLDNKRITGSIPDMIEDAVDFVSRNLRTKTIIDSSGHREDRTEYPLEAVREAVLNALIHRDYSALTENTPISIEIYRDRMEISSKGGLYGGGSLNQLGKGRLETRNPVLANILELLRVTENRYSGIPTIFKSFEKAHLPEPQFIVQHGLFKVIFRNGIQLHEDSLHVNKSDLLLAVVQFCQTPKSRDEITAFTGKSRYYTMSSIVSPLIMQGRLRMTMPEKPKSANQRYVAKK
jgi:ATP-dependent DNA helicase RecG